MCRNLFLYITLTIIAASISAGCMPGSTSSLDIIILNGKIVDGTGNPWYYGDVGIRGDVIVEIGNLSSRNATTIIDAEGLVVSPGFIDMHTHVDDAFNSTDANAILNYLIQGVTTVIPGSDGSGTYKIAETKRQWESNGMGTNAAMYVGFNKIRNEVLGENQLREPTSDELNTMQSFVRQAMQEGAWGISTGLEYGGYNLYVSTEEVIAVTEPVAEFGGVYKSHVRDEAKIILESIEEIIKISEETGVPVCITHLKPAGRDSWGLMKDVVNMVNSARARGIPVYADKYPWLQGAPIDYITGLIDIPDDMGELSELNRAMRNRDMASDERIEVRDIFVTELQSALQDRTKRIRLRESTYEKRPANPSAVARWGWQDFRIKVTTKNPQLAEKNIAELVDEQKRDGFDIIADLILSEPDILFAAASMSPDEMKLALEQEWVMISSDGGGLPIIPEDAEPVRAHPRQFASQAVTLRKYVREDRTLTLEEAVSKLASLPAQFLGMKDRGFLLEGFKADIAVFDPEAVRDNATYDNAHRYASGVDYVIVNGNISIENGEYSGALNGKVLLKNGM